MWKRGFPEAFFLASLWNQEVQGWFFYLPPEPLSGMPSHPTLSPRLCLCLPCPQPGSAPSTTWPPHTVQRPQEQHPGIRGGNRTALLSEPPTVQMGPAGGAPSGPRLAA